MKEKIVRIKKPHANVNSTKDKKFVLKIFFHFKKRPELLNNFILIDLKLWKINLQSLKKNSVTKE